MADLALKAQIAEAEKKIAEAKSAIAKAKGAGIDVAAMEKTLQDQIDMLNKLKAAYG